VLVLYLAAVVAALAGGLLAGHGQPLFLATLLVAAVLGGAGLVPLVARRAQMPVTAALRAHSVLVIERVVLASAVVGLGLGAGWQLGLAIPMVALTWWSQSVMRIRHELGAGKSLASPVGPVTLKDLP
jgi:4-hydroxybenzoate polyprenyltransferase/geranylgeranylglycerol-phosphate geranylgeranyltransferase